MEPKILLLNGIELAKSQPIVAIVILCIIALLFYFKTKPMLKIAAILLAFAFLYYMVSLFQGVTSTGISQKEKIIEKGQ